MKKLYSTSNLVKAVSLGTVMTSLLSSVSPVFAANLAITGGLTSSSSAPGVAYAHGSHGSIVLAGDDNFCGADTVIGRGGIQQANAANPITAEEQYNRFITDQKFVDRNPYGTTTEKVTWGGNSWTNPRGGYMGALTGGVESAMPEAYGVYSFATGCGSAATGNYSTAFGAGATAKTGGAQAFGVSALAAGKVSVAMGVGSEASGEATVAIGGLATASSKNSVALGTKTKADKNYAIAIGSEAEALGSGAIAIGSRDSDRTPEANRKVTAKGENAIAIGTHTYAEAEDSVAIGANAQVKVYDGVAIGGGSLSDRAKGIVGYDPYLNGDSTETGLAWKSTAGAFSVGEVGGNGNGKLTRQITGVAAGSEDTDAVNVAQLKAMRDVIAGGGAWKLSANDTNPTDVNPSNTVDFSVKNNNEVGKDNLKIEKGSANNKHNVKFALSDTLQLTSVTTGQSSMSNNGFMITNGAKITIDGIDAGKQQITGVADATADDHAVNYKQLKEVKDGFKTSWQLSVNGQDATHIGPNGSVNLQSAGNKSNPNIQIIKNSDNTVEFGLSDNINVKSVTAETSVMNADGFMFTDGNGPSITVNGINAGDQKITKVARGTEDTDAVNFAQLNEIKNEMAGDSLVKWDEGEKLITIGKEKGGRSITVQNNKGGGRTIEGVAFGAVRENSSEAINGAQLYAMGRDIARYFGGGASYEGGRWTDPTFIVLQPDEKGAISGKEYHNVADALGGVSYSIGDIYYRINNPIVNDLVKWDEGRKLISIGSEKGGESISVRNNAGINRVIKGVASGAVNAVSFDAINGSQLYAMGTDIAGYFGGGASYESGTWTNPTFRILQPGEDGIFTSASYNNVADAFRGVNSSITNLRNRIFNIKENSLVKWDEDEKFITIGAEKGGIEIKVANSEGENRIISGVAVGKVSSDSTEAINGHQLFSYITNIVDFFGGEETDVLNGIKPTFTVQKTKHNNVTDAFAAVDSSITDIYSQINNVTENSLVKWHEDQKLITIGKEKGGTKIDIAGTEGERTIAGVKNGKISENSTEAINGSQINQISGDIANFFGGNAKFINGAFVKPRYNLTTIEVDGSVRQKEYNDVGSALDGLDKNVRIVNANLISGFSDVAKYFGGGAGYNENGEWHAPTFKVYQINDNGAVSKKPYDNVADAFEGVNNTFTNIHNQISDITKNSLVKQEGGASGVITIGKDTAGTEINIAGYGKVERSISGVKAAEKGDEAVNKDQLDKSIEKISKDIETASAAAVLYDKNDNGNVNYGSVTLGGDKNNGPVALRNVKDGSISENSNDAINGSQINKISADIAKFFGGGAKFINGAFEGLKYTLSAIVDGKVGKADFYDVGSALKGLDSNVQDVNKRLTNVSNEFNQKIEDFSKDALLWDDEEEAFVARHEKDGKKTNSKLKYLLDGEIAKGSTDAITGNQLYFMSNQLANYFGGGAKYENGKWTGPTFKIVQVNADGTTVEKEHHNVADAFGDVNKNMSNINNRIDDVINKVDSDALKWNSDKKAYDAGRDGKPSKIINVADGKIAEGSKDAVNGGQLWETNERVTSVEKDVKHLNNRVDNISTTVTNIGETVFNIENKVDNIDNKVNDIAEDAVRYDRDENGKKTNKITLAGGDPSEPVMIDNVADGKIEKGSKEAVNGGQLHDYTQEQMKIILDQSKHYTDQRINNITIDAIDDAVDRAKQYTDMKFDVLNYSIESVKKEARQAAAIGLAVSNLRYNDTPGKLSVGFGTGLWRSQSAFAFGAGYTSENGKYRSNISATTSGGHWGVGAGFNMTLN
ncbi:Vomp family autotransporter [Bartonella sp. MR168JLCBS]|uniref:Vomp family autotransporter n=1 Tax=Bartonella sp. MR168JLCBS TaxID=3243556 RepID=UPI0035CF172C